MPAASDFLKNNRNIHNLRNAGYTFTIGFRAAATSYCLPRETGLLRTDTPKLGAIL